MYINNINIRNFQCYYGNHELKFGEGLNIIIGKGGKGKSKLFNALNWALFGRIYVTDYGWLYTDKLPYIGLAMDRFEYINSRALFETEIGSKVEVSVSLSITTDDEKEYNIERIAIAERKNEEEWNSIHSWIVQDSILKVEYESGTGTKIVTDPLYVDDIITSIFPVDIRNYIWFQGETLSQLINFRDKRTLEKAVKHISYYPYYVKLSNIITKSNEKIKKLEQKAVANANAKNKNIKELLSHIEKYRNLVEREEKNKQEHEDNILKIQAVLAEDEAKMSGIAKFATISKEYGELNTNIAKINGEITELDNYQRRQVPRLWVLRGIDELVKKSKQIIEAHKEEEYQIPEKKYLDNPSRSKLEEILYRDHQCFVCGSEVREGMDTYNWIVDRIKRQEEYLQEMEDYTQNLQFSKQFNMFIGQIQDYPDSLLISLKAIDKQWQENEEKMYRLIAERKKYKKRLDELDDQKELIKKKHGIDPVREGAKYDILDSGINFSRRSLASEEKKLNNSKETLLQYKNELAKYERELDKLGKSSGSDVVKVSETEWRLLTTFMEDICKKVQEEERKALREKLQVKANEFYRMFTSHDTGYKGKVVINPDYSIDFDPLLNTSHEERKKMSVINALLYLNQEAMDVFYPFITDAPTSNFDTPTTCKYLLGLKEIFKQSIVITKDVEIGSDYYKELYGDSHVSKIYEIVNKIYVDSEEPESYEVSSMFNEKK